MEGMSDEQTIRHLCGEVTCLQSNVTLADKAAALVRLSAIDWKTVKANLLGGEVGLPATAMVLRAVLLAKVGNEPLPCKSCLLFVLQAGADLGTCAGLLLDRRSLRRAGDP